MVLRDAGVKSGTTGNAANLSKSLSYSRIGKNPRKSDSIILSIFQVRLIVQYSAEAQSHSTAHARRDAELFIGWRSF